MRMVKNDQTNYQPNAQIRLPLEMRRSFLRNLKFLFLPNKSNDGSPTLPMTRNVVRSYPTPIREPTPIV